jgi:hypothetical protein
MMNKTRGLVFRARTAINRVVASVQTAALRTVLRLQAKAASTVYRLRTEQAGQSTWVNELMILGIVLIVAALIFAFWKAGGMAWVNSRLNDITTY